MKKELKPADLQARPEKHCADHYIQTKVSKGRSKLPDPGGKTMRRLKKSCKSMGCVGSGGSGFRPVLMAVLNGVWTRAFVQRAEV